MSITFNAYLSRQANLNISEAVGSAPARFSLKQFREKRWCYIGIINEEIISGTALVHLGFAANAFSFVYDRKNQRMIEKGFVIPPASLRFERDADNGQCQFSNSKDSITMQHAISQGKRLLDIQVGKGSAKHIMAKLEISEAENSLPLQLFTPMQNGKKAFTQKISGLPVSGYIETAQKRFEISASNSFAIFDWTNGFHNRITEWNWASAGGYDNQQKRIGFNFSRKVYTKGFRENVIWFEGKPELQSDIMFDYDASAPLKPWHIFSTDKKVDLIFTPEAKRQANENLILIKSNFIQACGSFSGTLCKHNAERITVENLGGVVEEHFAKW